MERISRFNCELGDFVFNKKAELNIIVFSEIINSPDSYFEELRAIPLEAEMFNLKEEEYFPIKRIITDDNRWGLKLEKGKFYFVVLPSQEKVCQVQTFHHLQHLVRTVGGDEKEIVDKLSAYWNYKPI